MSITVHAPTAPGQGYSVADSGTWVPGLYDTPETAQHACRFSNADLYQIRRVWQHDGENRPATMEDLASIVRGLPVPAEALDD
jgi:hypothetical protein